MAKSSMNDLVILLPGIMGSSLEQRGRVVWDTSVAALWAGVRSGGGSILGLKLEDDDPASETAGDVVATKLIDDLVIIPGFWKSGGYKRIDGYTGLYESLTDAFELEEVAPDDDEAGNLIRFAYDWRRDIRIAARRLARVAVAKLASWRRSGGSSKSRLILIGHSMGGLVAKYALEHEELWRSARALITFGTPYRGAPRALDYLVNGRSLGKFGIRFLDVTEVVRSFPAAYQLLPRYPVVETAGSLKRISEVGAEALGLDPALFRAQTSFHAELDRASAANRADPDYLRDRYESVQVVGIQQETTVGARWSGGVLTPTEALLSGLPEEYPDGDGTVPRLSAMPLDEPFRGFFAAQAHESLQDDEGLLTDLIARLKYLQAPDTGAFRGASGGESKGMLSLAVADATPAGEPVVIRSRVGGPSPSDGPGLEAVVMPVGGGEGRVVAMEAGEDGWSTAAVSGLTPGFYRATARAAGISRAGFSEVTAAFAVIEAEECAGDV